MINNIFGFFHTFILSFFVLIFLCGCGYKADPFYERPENTKPSKTELINEL